MPRAVKAKPTLRDEHAAQTRRRILEAASTVFNEHGFGARIEDVAVAAGVAVPTIYKVFSNKRNLLVSALDTAMRGEDGEGTLEQQSWFTEQLAEPDPARQLCLVARNARRMYERAGSLLNVLRAAAPVDADLSAAWDDIAAQRIARSGRTAANLVTKSDERLRLGRDELALTLLTLTEPELYATYTRTGRSPAAYEAWLGDILCRTVLNG